ncbi:SOS response-associated peptidase [Flagellimonas nanhaiensis]|uniref:Abasic site processing protein n=1 Tax=Flagellimonas nanhaiensis TaxID=2292706 RepID=A0A371JLA2_9FLAO|nr:SOS response-associated peptidase family protein [Allomuricauda nanhaiensis]RDY57735.1 hypothetical protein DX873_17710 [Allomuricauda nanhaiensis]
MMCYSTSNREKSQSQMERELEAQLRHSNQYRFYFWMNGFSHGEFNAVTQEDPKHIEVMKWGIVEPNTQNVEERWKILRGKSLNTQSEHVFENARTEDAILDRRCIVPVTGYFEPYYVKKDSYPHLVKPIHETYLGLLGVYNVIDGVRYTSILTTDANGFMLHVHNQKKRQPIMLDPYYWGDWLDSSINEGQIRQLMFQCDTEQEMEAFTVLRTATTGNKPNNVPEVLEPLHFPEVVAQQKFDIKQMETYNDNLDNLNAGFGTSTLFG